MDNVTRSNLRVAGWLIGGAVVIGALGHLVYRISDWNGSWVGAGSALAYVFAIHFGAKIADRRIDKRRRTSKSP